MKETRAPARLRLTVAGREPWLNEELEVALARLRYVGTVGEDIAQRLGMSPASFSRIRTGRRLPSPETARRIAEMLGSTVAALWPELQEDQQ